MREFAIGVHAVDRLVESKTSADWFTLAVKVESEERSVVFHLLMVATYQIGWRD